MNKFDLFSFDALQTNLMSHLRGLGFIGKRSTTLIDQVAPLDKEVEFDPTYLNGFLLTYYPSDSHVKPGDIRPIRPYWHSYSLSDGNIVYETDSDGAVYQKKTERINVYHLYYLYGKIGNPWTKENVKDPEFIGCYPAYFEKAEKKKEIRYTVKTTTTYETQTPNSSQNQ